MKILKIKAPGFGQFKEWESPDINKDIVVVAGSNESGKTTIFKLISTVFYGWHPVLNNPYIPWDGTAAQCELHLLDKSGQLNKVYRRLKSRPEGSQADGENIFNLGNGAIRQLSGLPFEIFNEVYAVTIDQMGFPEHELWQRLQDQILGGQYTSFMKPVNSVISELQSQANSLWRTDRQGKPKDKLLQEELKELRARLQDIEQNEHHLRNLEQKLYNLNGKLEELISRKAKLNASLDRFERLYPVKKKFEKISELINNSENIDHYSFIPTNPGRVIQELEGISKSLEQELKSLLSRKELFLRRKEQFTSADDNVYRYKEEIKEISRSYSQIESDYVTLNDGNNEEVKLTSRLQDRAKDFLKGGWRSELSSILAAIDEAELRAAINAFKKNEIMYNQLEARVGSLRARAAERKASKLIPVMLLIALPVITGIFLRNTDSSVLFPVLSSVILACFVLICWIVKSNSYTGIEIKDAEKNLNKITGLRVNYLQAIKVILNDLPIAAQRLESPDESLLVDINTLKELMVNLQEYTRKRESIISRIKEKKRAVNYLLQLCDIRGDGILLKDITVLENCLNKAELHYKDYHDAANALEEIDSLICSVEGKKNAAEKEIKSIVEGLNPIQGNNLTEKISSLEELRKLHHRALTLKEELEHDYPDLDNIAREINEIEQDGNMLVFDTDEIGKTKGEIELINLEINSLNEGIGYARKESEQRQGYGRLDDIKGQIASVEDERKQTAYRRDRLILMKRVLLEADRVFREENQPDVLLRAGSYIDSISGGRYKQIFVREDVQTNLMVKSNYADYPIDIKQPLSRGTVEQIYFALRLALLDHLDNDSERLPVFLDEVLVNWDEHRTDNGLKLLKSIAQKRQVFLFTCHSELVEMLSRNDDIQIINL